MPGIVFTSTTYSYSGIEWTTELYDRYQSTTENHSVKSVSPVITYDSDRKLDPWSTILFSKCDWVIQVEADDEDGNYDDLINDLIQGDEDQYYLRVYREGALFWVGVVLVDQIIKPRDAFPYHIKITASDGLKRLDNIELAQVTSSQVNLVQFLRDILVRTSINNAISASDDFLTVACRYYEGQMGSYAATFDPLRHTRVYDVARLSVRSNTDGRIDYNSQMDLLGWVLKLFGMRLLMINGHYHAIQVDAYSESSIRLHTYSQNINFNADTSINLGTTSSAGFVYAKAIAQSQQILDGDHYSFGPPVRRVSIKRDLAVGLIIQPSGNFADLSTETIIGQVVQGNFSTGIVIDMGNMGVGWTNASAPANFRVTFAIQLRINSTTTDYYLTNANGTIAWSTSSAARFLITVNAQAAPVGSTWFTILPINSVTQRYFIATPPIPISGALSFVISATFATLGGTDITADFTDLNYSGEIQAYYTSFSLGLAPQNGIVYLFGDKTASSYVIDIGDTQIGDAPNTSEAGKLQVYTGSAWADASTWRRFSGAADPNRLMPLLIETIYRLQQRALHILNATLIRSDVTPLNTITVESKKLLFQNGVFNTEKDEWQGSWIEIAAYNVDATGSGATVNQSGNYNAGYANIGSQYGKVNKTAQIPITIALTDAIATGTISTLSIVAPGDNVANSGNSVYILNPLTGDSEALVLSAALLDDSTSISFTSKTLTHTYPKGSIIFLKSTDLAARIYALENP